RAPAESTSHIHERALISAVLAGGIRYLQTVRVVSADRNIDAGRNVEGTDKPFEIADGTDSGNVTVRAFGLNRGSLRSCIQAIVFVRNVVYISLLYAFSDVFD